MTGQPLRWAQAHTTILFQDESTREVPHGETISVHDGWIAVTRRVHLPDHDLSKAGDGWVEQTVTWPSSAVKRIETIREAL